MVFANLPEFLGYSDFIIENHEGKHTVCKVLLSIDPDTAESFLSASEQRRKVEVFSNSGDRVMEGIISAVAVDYGVTSTTAEVTIISESFLLQEKSKERIFQNPEKTYSDILKNFDNIEIGKCEHINDVVEEIIYQHNIDDFSFLLYLARKCDTGLWITEDGKISFGMINCIKSISDSEKVYNKSIIEKKIIAQKSGRKIDILTMEHFPNGSILKNEQSEYVIFDMCIYEYHDEVHFRYSGYTSSIYDESLYNPEYIITNAKVTDNKDPENLGRIQVDFLSFQDNDSKKIWINYTTPFVGANNGGCVFIPDVGDEIFVCILNGKAYGLNSLRVNVLPDDCRDVSKKFFAIKDSVITVNDKEISFKQGDKSCGVMNSDLVILKHDKSMISIDDSAVTNKIDESTIILKSDIISSKTGKSVLELTSSEIKSGNEKGKVIIKNGEVVVSGGKSGLSLKNGKSELSGDSINLSTQCISF